MMYTGHIKSFKLGVFFKSRMITVEQMFGLETVKQGDRGGLTSETSRCFTLLYASRPSFLLFFFQQRTLKICNWLLVEKPCKVTFVCV